MASPAVACSTANCFAVAIPPSGYAGVPQGGMRPPLRSVRCLPVVALLLPYGTAPDGAFTRRRAEQRTLPGGDLHLHSPPIRSAPYLPRSVEFGSGEGPLVYQLEGGWVLPPGPVAARGLVNGRGPLAERSGRLPEVTPSLRRITSGMRTGTSVGDVRG